MTTLQSPSDSRILDDAHAASLRRSKSAEHSLACDSIQCDQDQTFIEQPNTWLHSNPTTDEQLTQLWEVEEGPQIHSLSEKENRCEVPHSKDTRRELQEGRHKSIIFPLPRHFKIIESSDLHVVSFGRYNSVTSLAREPSPDNQFIQGYKTRSTKIEGYYLSLYTARREHSLLRLVCNASVRTPTRIALINTFMTGPTIQIKLFAILTKVRQTITVVTVDVITIRETSRPVIQTSPNHPLAGLFDENYTDKTT